MAHASKFLARTFTSMVTAIVRADVDAEEVKDTLRSRMLTALMYHLTKLPARSGAAEVQANLKECAAIIKSAMQDAGRNPGSVANTLSECRVIVQYAPRDVDAVVKGRKVYNEVLDAARTIKATVNPASAGAKKGAKKSGAKSAKTAARHTPRSVLDEIASLVEAYTSHATWDLPSLADALAVHALNVSALIDATTTTTTTTAPTRKARKVAKR
jgi:urease gamma subunit